MSQFIKFYFTSSMFNMFQTCGDTIEKSQVPDGCINVRNMLSIEEVK